MMEKIEQISLSYFKRLSNLNTLPFYEKEIRSEIVKICKENDLNFNLDEWGNLYVNPKINSNDPAIVFIAHMDHPGFEITEQNGKMVKLKILGSHPNFVNNNDVVLRVLNSAEKNIFANITPSRNKHLLNESYNWIRSDYIYAELSEDIVLDLLPCPAILDLKKNDIHYSRRIIRSRAIDDLAGCAAILSAMKIASEIGFNRSVIGLFTRAEEVGLIGARLSAQSGKIDKNSLVFSIETSSEIPGIKIGQGPVIRTGDRISTFDHIPETLLKKHADKLKETDNSFNFQRGLMDAGVCEGSAFKSFGYNVSGLAFPLGNWHNRGKNMLEEEYLSMDDYYWGIRLLLSLMSYDIHQKSSDLLPLVPKSIEERLTK